MTEATVTTTTIYSGNYIYQNNQMISQAEDYLKSNAQSAYEYRLEGGAKRTSQKNDFTQFTWDVDNVTAQKKINPNVYSYLFMPKNPKIKFMEIR